MQEPYAGALRSRQVACIGDITLTAERKCELVHVARGMMPTRRDVDRLPGLYDAGLDAWVLRCRAWVAKQPLAAVLLLPVCALGVGSRGGDEPGFAANHLSEPVLRVRVETHARPDATQ